MADITFLNLQFLWALFILPLIIALHFFLLRYTHRRAVLFANFDALKRVTGAIVLSKNITLLITRVLVVLFLILSASGIIVWTKGPSSDFNYVIAIDASSSMLADDLAPNRLAVAKETADDFAKSLNAQAKIGVISFAGVNKINSVMTEQRPAISKAINDITISKAGGTDITGAITTAVNLLITEFDKSKSIVILTDGQHTVGSPIEEGLTYAAQNRVVVHTIGIATTKGGSFELTQLLSTINEETLQRISANTGGKSFKVGTKAEMAAAFNEIVTLSEQNVPHQLRLPLLLIALFLLLLEWTLLSTRFKMLP